MLVKWAIDSTITKHLVEKKVMIAIIQQWRTGRNGFILECICQQQSNENIRPIAILFTESVYLKFVWNWIAFNVYCSDTTHTKPNCYEKKGKCKVEILLFQVLNLLVKLTSAINIGAKSWKKKINTCLLLYEKSFQQYFVNIENFRFYNRQKILTFLMLNQFCKNVKYICIYY